VYILSLSPCLDDWPVQAIAAFSVFNAFHQAFAIAIYIDSVEACSISEPSTSGLHSAPVY
jgi:hypothetical protein